jgi:hypothetical protein
MPRARSSFLEKIDGTKKIQPWSVTSNSTFSLWRRVLLKRSYCDKRQRNRLQVSGMPRLRSSLQEKIDGTKIRESSVKVYSIRWNWSHTRHTGWSIDGNLCWRSQHELGNHATYTSWLGINNKTGCFPRQPPITFWSLTRI